MQAQGVRGIAVRLLGQQHARLCKRLVVQRSSQHTDFLAQRIHVRVVLLRAPPRRQHGKGVDEFSREEAGSEGAGREV